MICRDLKDCCEREQFVCAYKKECIVYKDFRQQATCEERNKRYNLINDRNCKIALFHMDGGIVRNEKDEQKCDYLYIVHDQKCPTAIFVELKGKNIHHAVEQLRASINRYGTELNRRICARVICSSVPRLYNDPMIKNLKKDLLKQYKKGTLFISEKNMEEKYSNI